MELKVGMKAKCLSHTYEDDKYFTVGKCYEITFVEHPLFEVITNDGTTAYCLTGDCAHGKWEFLDGRVMDKMREEFEVAYVMNICGCDAERAKAKIKHLDGEGLLARHSKAHDYKYCLQSTDDAWWAWKASRAALCVELPENCNGMALTVDEFYAQLDKAGVSYK